jgi:hypothetical protein
MQLPLLSGEDYTVKEYPSNREVEDLIRVILKSAGEEDAFKRQLIERPGFSKEDISEEITPKEADMKMAEIVFKEDLPRSADWTDLSPNALREGIVTFFGIGDKMSGGRGLI